MTLGFWEHFTTLWIDRKKKTLGKKKKKKSEKKSSVKI
jgi:hypothetical protein